MSGCARPGMKPRRCSGRCQMMRSGLSREVSIRKIGQQHEHVFWRAPQPLTAREVAELVLVAAKVDKSQEGRCGGPYRVDLGQPAESRWEGRAAH